MNKTNIRKKAFIVLALVKFVNRVDAPCGRHIVEKDFVWTDANDWTILFE